MNISVEYNHAEFQVEVSYKIRGRYHPATQTDPEEHPEVEWQVESMVMDDLDVVITDKELISEIEKHMNETMDIETEILEHEASRVEARAEMERDERLEREW